MSTTTAPVSAGPYRAVMEENKKAGLVLDWKIYSNTARDALQRLEMMMLLSGATIPQRAMRQQIASALNMVLHVSRLSDGSRKVMKVAEVTGMEGDVVMMQDLFEFKRTGIGVGGKVLGQFRPTGVRSMYTDRVAAAGYRLDASSLMR